MDLKDNQDRENISVAVGKLRDALEELGFEQVVVLASVTRNDTISSYHSLGEGLDMKEIGARLMLISNSLTEEAFSEGLGSEE